MFPLPSIISSVYFPILRALAQTGPGFLGLPFDLTTDRIIYIAGIIIALAILWFVLRTILRITLRFFALGCGAILVIGLVLVLIRIFSR